MTGRLIDNPMRIPKGFMAARAFGLQMFKEQDASMKPACDAGTARQLLRTGDDGAASEDSREYGMIRRDHIIGEAIWPEHLGLAAQARASEVTAQR
ncbi:MAG TPA: hypothetical protein VMD06_12600 [Steroidobacteraceae bacterium]|nr:hypothetical protein [Steroidobacteraceae bacterium]